MKTFQVLLRVKTLTGEVITCEYRVEALTEGTAVAEALHIHGCKLHQVEKFRVTSLSI